MRTITEIFLFLTNFKTLKKEVIDSNVSLQRNRVVYDKMILSTDEGEYGGEYD